MKKWVRGRTRRKRPTLTHLINTKDPRYTACWLDTWQWPWRRYTDLPGDSLFICMRCQPHQLEEAA